MPQVVIIARDPLICQAAADRHSTADSETVRREAADLDLSAVFNDLGSVDLFATQRIFHYRDFLSLRLGAKQQERLKQILARIPAETLLICSQVLNYERRAEEQKALKGTLYKAWTDGVKVEDLRGHSEGDAAAKWLGGWSRERYGLNLPAGQIKRLLTACQDSPSLVDSELRKLWMLKAGDGVETIQDDTIARVLSSNPGAHFYEMVDAVMAGSPDWQRRLAHWVNLEPEPHRLLNELKRRLLGLYDLDQGRPVYPPFFAQQLQRQAGRWRGERLGRAVRGLADLEYRMKSGGTTGETSVAGDISALQLYLAELAG